LFSPGAVALVLLLPPFSSLFSLNDSQLLAGILGEPALPKSRSLDRTGYNSDATGNDITSRYSISLIKRTQTEFHLRSSVFICLYLRSKKLPIQLLRRR
ncbi:hypothetical protein, partial [Microcoleus sp. D3_18a_C4]|uniref:hypothetical protein n=1 Tax=Microcoleus sp. D3_18a_C4 TaxID=3055332 RepID=UPI002FCFA934